MKLVKVVGLTAFLAAQSVFAHDFGSGRDYGVGPRPNLQSSIDSQQWRQRNRISNGVRSGQLTPFEYDRLARQQNRIERIESRFLSDGYLDWRERRILRNKLERASNDIQYFKHNDHYYGNVYAYR